MKKTFLINGASGGMIGAAYFRELYLRQKKGERIVSQFSLCVLGVLGVLGEKNRQCVNCVNGGPDPSCIGTSVFSPAFLPRIRRGRTRNFSPTTALIAVDAFLDNGLRQT